MQHALAPKPVWSATTRLPRGNRGTVQTLRLMAHFCRRDAGNQELRNVAHRIIGSIAGHDFSGEIRALYEFCRDQIRYRKDPVDVERVQDALRTLQFGSGDCDDKSVLLATLLATCGHRARFCVSGPAPGQWTHVYVEVRTPKGWLALDPTPERANAGWETQAQAKGIFEIWPAVSTNIRVIRAAKQKRFLPSSEVRILGRRRSVAPPFAPCLACDECAEYGLGADTYEWKKNKSSGECELKKKSCGFFCKVGKGFKAVGKVALAVAPVALAPFTGGASLAAGTATWGATAAAIGAAAAGSVAQMIAARQGVPAGANVEEPKGECAVWLQQKQQEEQAKAQAAAAAAQAEAAAVAARAKAEAREEKAEKGGGLLSNPWLLAALVIGGAMVLKR